MTGKIFIALSFGIVVASTMAAVQAADAQTPAQVQKTRHEHYEQLGEDFKSVRDASRSANPDWSALEKAVAAVNQASVNQGQWFPKGTGPEAGKTRALPEIWSKPAEFVTAQNMFADNAAKLLAATKARNVENVRGAFREVGGACKNCHDTFRAPED